MNAGKHVARVHLLHLLGNMFGLAKTQNRIAARQSVSTANANRKMRRGTLAGTRSQLPRSAPGRCKVNLNRQS